MWEPGSCLVDNADALLELSFVASSMLWVESTPPWWESRMVSGVTALAGWCSALVPGLRCVDPQMVATCETYHGTCPEIKAPVEGACLAKMWTEPSFLSQAIKELRCTLGDTVHAGDSSIREADWLHFDHPALVCLASAVWCPYALLFPSAGR